MSAKQNAFCAEHPDFTILKESIGLFYMKMRQQSMFKVKQCTLLKIFVTKNKIYFLGNHTQRGKNHTYGIFQQGNYAIIEITADVGLRKLTCNAPVWNTTGWGKKSLDFKIACKLLYNDKRTGHWF